MNIGLVLIGISDSRTVGEMARVAASFQNTTLKFIGPRVEFDQKCFEFADNGSQKLVDAKTFLDWSDFGQRGGDSIRIAFNGSHGLRYDELKSETGQTIESITERIRNVLLENTSTLANIDFIFCGPQQETKYNSDQLCAFISEWQSVLASSHFICAPPPLPLSLQAFLSLTRATELPAAIEKPMMGPGVDGPKELRFPEEKLQEWLTALGIDVHRGEAYSSLKRLLNGRLASNDELRVLSAVIQQTVRKLKQSESH